MTHAWNAGLHLYNEESPRMVQFRRRYARAFLDGLFTIAFIGDSKTAGYGTNGGGDIIDADSLPGQFRSIAGAGEGMAFANTFHGPGAGGIDTRWTGVSGLTRDQSHVDGQSLYLRTTPGVATSVSATFTTTEKCDSVAVYLWGSGSPFVTISIDGAPQSPVAVTNTAQWTRLSYGGLSNTTHAVRIASVVGVSQEFAVLGVKPGKLGQNLAVVNAGLCSAKASLWAPASNFDSPYASAVFTAFNAAIINLGTNPDTDTIGSLTALCNSLTGTYDVPVLLVVPGILDSSYDSLRHDLHTLADTLNLPLLDLSDVTGAHDAAAATGLTFDTLHESRAGYGVEASAVKAALVG